VGSEEVGHLILADRAVTVNIDHQHLDLALFLGAASGEGSQELLSLLVGELGRTILCEVAPNVVDQLGVRVVQVLGRLALDSPYFEAATDLEWFALIHGLHDDVAFLLRLNSDCLLLGKITTLDVDVRGAINVHSDVFDELGLVVEHNAGAILISDLLVRDARLELSLFGLSALLN